MARVHILKIGPFEDGNSIYLPIAHDTPTQLTPVAALDDEAGLQAILDQGSADEIVCSPELATIANKRGLLVEEVPPDFEGTRIQVAMDHAQDGALDGLTTWGHLLLMTGVQDFVQSSIANRWPLARAFDVRLEGDRNAVWAGWIDGGNEPSVTLVRARADADALASAPVGEQATRLASIDHLSIRIVEPPPYALAPIREFYGIDVMPVFEIVANGAPALATDEDAFILNGVLAALAALENVDGVASAESDSPHRKVRTFVGAALAAAGSRVN